MLQLFHARESTFPTLVLSLGQRGRDKREHEARLLKNVGLAALQGWSVLQQRRAADGVTGRGNC